MSELITLFERIATLRNLFSKRETDLVRIDYLVRKDCDQSCLPTIINSVDIGQNWLPCSKGLRRSHFIYLLIFLLYSQNWLPCSKGLRLMIFHFKDLLLPYTIRIDYLVRKDCDSPNQDSLPLKHLSSELITLFERIATEVNPPTPLWLLLYVRIDYLVRKDCDFLWNSKPTGGE